MLSHRALFAVLSLAALNGCEEAFQDRFTRAEQRAERKQRDGDYRAAMQYYEEALDGTAKTAELHYKLALIHDDKLNNPAGALHHFQRYIDLAPKGRHAKEAREFSAEAEHKLGRKLSKGGLMTQEDAARLKNENLSLRNEIAGLRAQPKTQSAEPRTAEQRQKPLPAGARTYTVQHGDTLASISRRYYNTSNRWKDIQDANFYKLEGTAVLKPGMTLIIP